jgi:predicted RNA polymerase sigma factor
VIATGFEPVTVCSHSRPDFLAFSITMIIYRAITVQPAQIKNRKSLTYNEIRFYLVHLRTQFSNSFYANLEEIYSLKELLYNEGYSDKSGALLVSSDLNPNLILPQGH